MANVDRETVVVGMIKPVGHHQALAVKALDEGRLEDAAKHIAALPDEPMLERAWKLHLSGLLRLNRGDLGSAEEAFLCAAAMVFTQVTAKPEASQVAMRLAAAALRGAGVVQRRRERGREALLTHTASLRLREQHGSIEEQWESAVELGLDAIVVGEFEQAARWQRRAIELAEKATESPLQKQAIAYTHLAEALRQGRRVQEAVEASRDAVKRWKQYDSAAPEVPEAELQLGDVLTQLGEVSLAEDESATEAALREAVDVLAIASQSLAAFGSRHERRAKWGEERLEFARRLLATVVEDLPSAPSA